MAVRSILDLPMVRVTSPTTWEAMAKAVRHMKMTPKTTLFSRQAAEVAWKWKALIDMF